MLLSRILSYFPNGGVKMKYYMYADNQTVQMLREVLEEEAQKNPVWTLQELFAMCRNLSFLDDVPENADYFDEIYLILSLIHI